MLPLEPMHCVRRRSAAPASPAPLRSAARARSCGSRPPRPEVVSGAAALNVLDATRTLKAGRSEKSERIYSHAAPILHTPERAG